MPTPEEPHTVAACVLSVPTDDDVAAAFDDCGGSVVQAMALRFALEKRGFGFEAATDAINAALAANVLGRTPAGGLFLVTKNGPIRGD